MGRRQLKVRGLIRFERVIGRIGSDGIRRIDTHVQDYTPRALKKSLSIVLALDAGRLSSLAGNIAPFGAQTHHYRHLTLRSTPLYNHRLSRPFW